MNKRMLLAGLSAGLVGFFLGWVFFGTMLADHYKSNTDHYDRLLRPEVEVNLMRLFMADVIFGILVALAAWKLKLTSFTKGLISGALIGFLVFASLDLFFPPQSHMFSTDHTLWLNLVMKALWAGGMGGMAGFLFAHRKSSVYRHGSIYQ